MDFIPKRAEVSQVPYFDDVTAEDGWQGHTTGKSIQTLKAEIATAVARLGGMVMGFQAGTYLIGDVEREGYRIRYTIEQPNGQLLPGQMDIAALPVRKDSRRQRSYRTRGEKSLKMALYMLRNALEGLWFLQQLSPGYAPLMPWMIDAHTGKTITMLWNEAGLSGNLLPPGEEFLEAEYVEEGD